MNRREFIIRASGGFFTAAFMPLPALPAPGSIQPTMTWFAVGNEGEFDWQAILAPDLRTAKLEWLETWSPIVPEELEDELACLHHMVPAEWQSLTRTPTGADWIRAGLGYHCDRCHYETSAFDGGQAVGDEVVCSECMTLEDWCVVDRVEAVERLTDALCDDYEHTMEWLVSANQESRIPPDILNEALAAAAAYT